MAKWRGSTRNSLRRWRRFMAEVRAGRVKVRAKPKPERWGWQREMRRTGGDGQRA